MILLSRGRLEKLVKNAYFKIKLNKNMYFIPKAYLETKYTVDLVDYFESCCLLRNGQQSTTGYHSIKQLFLPNLITCPIGDYNLATFKRASSMCSAVNKFAALILCAPTK